MSSKTYYLFGRDAVRIYHDGGLPEFDNHHSVEMAVFEYTANTHPSDLLEAYDGWDGYAIITEDEYKLLKELARHPRS